MITKKFVKKGMSKSIKKDRQMKHGMTITKNKGALIRSTCKVSAFTRLLCSTMHLPFGQMSGVTLIATWTRPWLSPSRLICPNFRDLSTSRPARLA